MTSLNLSQGMPTYIEDEIARLKKALPDQQVDNNLTFMHSNDNYEMQFYLELYSNIQSWGVQNFYWSKSIQGRQNLDDDQKNQLEKRNQSYNQSLQVNLVKKMNKNCILKSISHINFTNLKTLYITQSEIDSLQPLTWMDMKTIKTLILPTNKINSLKSLAKCCFDFVENINLGGNLIPYNQVGSLSRTKTKKMPNQNSYFWLFQQEENVKNKCINLTCMFKLEIQDISRIQFFQPNDINKKVKDCLKNRFQNLKILSFLL